ncbi:putative xyloglucan endotransglucosylase/hydrolase protein 28, partial [Bienertia sinuspersici]
MGCFSKRLIVSLVLFFCVYKEIIASSESINKLPIISFDEGYSHLFGNDNLMVVKDGKSVLLSLDERTGMLLLFFYFLGSGFMSHDLYLHGFFSASMKLPSDYTAGVVVAFYMSNADMYEHNHDELDIEFLGNIRGKEWRVQTNVYGNGSTSVGREERYTLWFDPSEEFHRYSVLWAEDKIIFYVDDVPIREIRRTEAMKHDFPSKPMSLYATIWDASTWATNGGKYKVDYRYAPYVAQFSDLVLHGCAVDPIERSRKCALMDGSVPSGITPSQQMKMASFRKKHLTYSYCYDKSRYKVPPSDCVVDSREADRLK